MSGNTSKVSSFYAILMLVLCRFSRQIQVEAHQIQIQVIKVPFIY